MARKKDRQVRGAPQRARLAAVAMTACIGLYAAPDARATDQLLPPDRRIPRYASLTAAPVNARVNPGLEARIKWAYAVRGLPVQVVARSGDWLRVCDPQGQFAWIHRRYVGRSSTVMNDGQKPVAMRARARADAPITGYLAARAVADLGDCGSAWCQISVAGTSGWAARSELWGVRKGAQCRLDVTSATTIRRQAGR